MARSAPSPVVAKPSGGPYHAGQAFGRLTLIERVDRDPQRRWRCVCECGAAVVAKPYYLRIGRTRSCGCLRRERFAAIHRTHGMSRRPEYAVWRTMKSRCHNARDPKYANYGARGIVVCDEWRASFADFFAHVGERPSRRHSLDRVNNDLGYRPGNVRWATQTEQARNKRTNHLITAFGATRTLSEWAASCGLSKNTIVLRMLKGMPAEQAISTPSRARRTA